MIAAYRKLLNMMTPPERKRFWILVVITFFLSLIEAGSVVSILPFLRLLSEPTLIETNATLAWLYDAGGFTSTQQFLTWTGFAVLCVTVFGLVLKMFTVWLTTRFALMRSYSFSARLLAKYLHQPYIWFLSRHSSDLGNAILSEVDKVVSGALLPAMRMIPDAFSVFIMLLILCIIEPEVALGGALLLGGVYGAIFFAVRRTLFRIGKTRMEANQARFHIVQEATGGLKELKIMGLEDKFLVRFRDVAFRMARVVTLAQVIQNIPRQVIEAVAFGGMIILILVLLARGDGSLAPIIPTLGLIAAIGLRLIPALQQVYMRTSSLRTADATLTRIHADLLGLTEDTLPDRKEQNARPVTPLRDKLELKAIDYAYPSASRGALDKLDLTIEANTTVGLVGGSGAGKTTTVDIILGLLQPDSGELRVDGTPIDATNLRTWQRTLGYVPQTIFLSDNTVAENIAFGLPSRDIDMAAVERAAKVAALHDFIVSELPNGYQTIVGERGARLSGGQRQRIGIARALYPNPSTLIFDEATSALDSLTEAEVMEAIQRIAGQKTIIMIAHRLSTVRNCDRIFLMRRGRVAAAGTFEELVQSDDEFAKMAGDLMAVKEA